MTNYIIEDDIDFFAELNTIIENKGGDTCLLTNEKIEDNTCLLTNEKLEYNHIQLECGHTFNYKPIFTEVREQKSKPSITDTIHLSCSQLKCPYCRHVNSRLLPYIPIDKSIIKISGVNDPSHYCMKGKHCSWVYKSGINKGTCCNSPAYEDECGIFCINHRKRCKNIKSVTDKLNNKSLDKSMLLKFTVIELKDKLRKLNLKISGRKSELIDRILKHM